MPRGKFKSIEDQIRNMSTSDLVKLRRKLHSMGVIQQKTQGQDTEPVKKEVQQPSEPREQLPVMRRRPQQGVNPYQLTEKQKKYLHDLYHKEGFMFGRDRLYQYVNQHYNPNVPMDEKISRRQIMEWLKTSELAQLYRPVRRKAEADIQRTIMKRPYEQIGVDLIDMQTKAVNGYNYILTAIDLHSKKGYAIQTKNKEACTTAAAMKKILDQMQQKPSSIRSDQGSEFMDAFAKLLKDRGIKQIFSKSHSPWSNGQIERFNGILKRQIEMWITQHDDSNWPKALPTLLNAYNSTQSRVTKKAPNDIESDPKMNKEVEENIRKEVTPKNQSEIQEPRFKIGMRVRITTQNEGFSKSFQKFSKDIYTIASVTKAKQGHVFSHRYKVRDQSKQLVPEVFYENQLQFIKGIDKSTKIKAPEKFTVSKIIRPIFKLGKKYLEVKWKGYKDTTIEPYANIERDVPKMLAAFQKKHNVIWSLKSVKYDKTPK